MSRIAMFNIDDNTRIEISCLLNDDYKKQIVNIDKNDLLNNISKIMLLITNVDFCNDYNHIIINLIETLNIPVIILSDNKIVKNNNIKQSPLLFIVDNSNIKLINLFIEQLLKTSNYIKHINNELKTTVKELNLYKKTYKAKVLLMKYEGFTEQQAHQYITKKSMQHRVSKEKIINEIVNKYNKY